MNKSIAPNCALDRSRRRFQVSRIGKTAAPLNTIVGRRSRLWIRGDDQMKIYIALFRGINVGGKNALPMKELVSVWATSALEMSKPTFRVAMQCL